MHHWLGRKHKPETILKIGEASKRSWRDPEFRAKQLDLIKNRSYRHSPETRAKMSQAMKGKNTAKGRHHTDEAKLKISNALKGRPSPLQGRKQSPEIIKKRIAAIRAHYNEIPSILKGIPKNAEHRAKISAGLMGHPGPHYSHTEEAKARISVACMGNKRGVGRIDSPEVKRRRAESLAAYFNRWPRPFSSLEKSLYFLLKQAGFEYVPQKHIGTKMVDAFVSSHNIAFEADGAYWHQDKVGEIKRDEYLMSKGVSAIIHLNEKDLAPWQI